MHALLVTIFISLMLVIFFVAMFWQQGTAAGGNGGSGEREALLPLEKDDGSPAGPGEGELREDTPETGGKAPHSGRETRSVSQDSSRDSCGI